MRIFEPARLGPITVKNRIVRSATHEGMGDREGFPTEGLAALYERIAKGGVGTLVTGYVGVAKSGRACGTMRMFDDDKFIDVYCPIVDRVKSHGTVIIQQIAHGGALAGLGTPDAVDTKRIADSCAERDRHFEELGKPCGAEERCTQVGEAAPECVDDYVALNDCLAALDGDEVDNCARSAPCAERLFTWQSCYSASAMPEVEVPEWVFEPGPGRRVELVGVNLAGADFGEQALPGELGTEYTYPTHEEVDYFVAKGMNVFRVPFRWERLQRTLNDDLESIDLEYLTDVVSYATDAGAYAVLDPHNYARYHDHLIGSEAVPNSAFADFWSRLATEFAGDDRVAFGLVNEPHDLDEGTEGWMETVNAVIAAIRETGADNLIMVPGNGWTGAHTWTEDWYGTPNGEIMAGVEDPADNFVFEVHQYLDPNASGTAGTCPSETIGIERLTTVTEWAQDGGFRLFLGEFGAHANPTCLRALDDMISYMGDNDDVWLGWTWWAAGPWWGDYFMSIEPEDGADKPQMDLLERHLTAP